MSHIHSRAAHTALCAAVLLALGIASDAQFVTYFDRAAFLTAAGEGLSLANFEGLENNSYQTLSSTNEPSIPSGVIFSSVAGGGSDLFVAPSNFNANPAIDTSTLFANFFGTPLIADFSPVVTAVGADVVPFDFNGNTATLTIDVRQSGGSTTAFSVTPPVGSSGFFGVIGVNGTNIDRITFTPPSGFTVGVDNFVFGIAEPVPAPSTLITVLVGAVPGICLLFRRHKQKHLQEVAS